jgi:putative hemolysin
MGRQLHCYAQFQKDYHAKQYWAEWVAEVNNGFNVVVEGKVKADEKEYYLVCNYSDDIGDWTLNATPITVWTAIGDPASEYCNENWWEFEIVSNDEDIYGQCTLENGIVCESWKFFNGECPALEWDDESEIWQPEFDLETEDGRLVACEERAWFYLNFGDGTFTWEDEDEGGASFVRNGHVVYEKWWEKWETDVECLIDMVDGSVNVEFSNQNSLWPIDE